MSYPANLEDPWPPIEPSENPGHLEPIPCARHDDHSGHPWGHPEYGAVECLGVTGAEQCSTAIHSAFGGAPSRCAFPSGHEGKCEP